MTQLRDLIIVLPGITGSVLEKDGREVWAASGEAFWQGVTTRFDSLRSLALSGVDDPQDDDLGDGVRATRLIDDIHIVPGIHKIKGYSDLRRLLTRHFEVVQGHIDSDQPANYFEFPYDWRRDNRVSARHLQHFIEERLPRWREYSGARDAKTILIGHSMGGLVSHYYLQVLGGWQDCKLLVTFGTPFRGSLNTIDSLVYGVRQFGVEFDLLTEVMKTLPSIYQLLPRYPAIKVEDQWLRVTETDVIPNLTLEVAKKGLSFMYEIDAAQEHNQTDARYHTHGYKTIPVVGTHQRTWQSARYAEGRVLLSYDAPAVVGEALATGDGTVPRVSAVPPELSSEYRDSFHPEKHASLQSNVYILRQLATTLETTTGRLDDVLASKRVPEPREAVLSLTVDDLYPANTPVTLEAALLNAVAGGELIITVSGKTSQTVRVVADNGVQKIELPPLAAGTYQLELAVVGGAATPVHDVFAVASVAGA